MTFLALLLARVRAAAPHLRLVAVLALMGLSAAGAWHARGVLADAARARALEEVITRAEAERAGAADRDAANEAAAERLRDTNDQLLRRIRRHENDPDLRCPVPCRVLSDLNRIAGAPALDCPGEPAD